MIEAPEQAVRRLAGHMIAKGFKLAALHEYCSASRVPLYWRIRVQNDRGEKWIRPMCLTGQGYELREPPTPAAGRTLYRLPELLADAEAVVWIVEGESCADALANVGKVSTTSGGASSAANADWTPLRDRRCVIWPDNDAPGHKYAEAVADRLLEIGCDVSLVDAAELDLLAHGDVVDWLRVHPATQLSKLPMRAVGGWPQPQLLIGKVASSPYPLTALPETVREAVAEVQAFVQAPTALVAASAVSAVAVAVQGLVDVKRAERLEGPTSLFMLTIADSGERKSTCDGMFTRAIREFEQDKQAEMEPLVKSYRADIAAWESRRDGLLAAIKAAARQQKDDRGFKKALRALEDEKPEPPRVPHLMLGDETPESLAWRLAKEWPSAAILSAEAGIVFGAHAMGKDSIMRSLARMNVFWDGGGFGTGRRTSESFEVRDVRLTLGLQVQEATLRDFFSRAGQLARGTGFLARFLVAWPESTQGNRPFREPPQSWPKLAAFHERIRQILNTDVPIDVEGRLAPAMLTLAPDAKEAWVDFHDAVESELTGGGDLQDVRDVASKAADNVVRLAALFHVFQRASGPVSRTVVEQASAIVAWHLSEARRFFGELALPAELLDAVRLDGWLIDYCRRERAGSVSTREAQRSGPIRDGQRLTAAINVLSDLDRVQLRHEGRRKLIAINPALVQRSVP